MKTQEAHISQASEYFQYTPSLTAQNTFFYPTCTGRFSYEAGYSLRRSSFDSFLLMYIAHGKMTLQLDEGGMEAHAGDFLLLDCYAPHAYSTDSGCEALWLHFDGRQARGYYDLIRAKLGNVFTIQDAAPSLHAMESVYRTFHDGRVIREALLSQKITEILTQLLLSDTARANDSIADVTSYINEHFAENLTIKGLADLALLSPYHFIRQFKAQVGFTPHEYLVNTRMNTAKYLLKNTAMSTKDICFSCGFSSESVFCNAFKKHTGMTPGAYRSNEGLLDT